MPVVQSRVPYYSTTGGVLGGLGDMLAAVFEAKEFERQKKLQEAALAREEEDRKRAQELQEFNIASKMREMAVEEAMTPEIGERPMVPEAATIPVETRTGGALSALLQPPGVPLPTAISAPEPPETVTTGGMTMPGPAPVEEAVIPALRFRGKEVAKERKIPKMYLGEVQRAEARKKLEEAKVTGSTEVTQEIFDQLPEVMQQFYPVGSVLPPGAKQAATTELMKEKKSQWGRPFTGPDDRSYQMHEETGEVRLTPGVGRKVEKPGADEIPQIPGADWAKTGEEFIATIPVSIRETVKKIANYEINPVALGRMKNRAVLIAAAAQYNPDYNDQLYSQRRQARLEFSSAKGTTPGSNIVALNTAVQHLDKLDQLSEGLTGSDIQKFNKLANYIKTNYLGSPTVTNFNTAATAVESELASLLKKAGATDQEIAVWRQNFNQNMSSRQLKGAINVALDLMKGRADALQHTWHLAMGENASDFPIYGKTQQKVLARLGYQVGSSPADIDKLTIEGPILVQEE